MNRRSFLLKLGAAAGAAVAATAIDPDKLLWVPGAKTIIDLGATKQVLPATDAEVLVVSGPKAYSFVVPPEEFHKLVEHAQHDLNTTRRDIKLEIMGEDGLVPFRFQRQPGGVDQLVSVHTEAELRLLHRPFGANPATHPLLHGAKVASRLRLENLE